MYQTDRQMFDVDLTCADCGAHIAQLPFQPSGDRPVYCRDCNRNRKPAKSNTGFGGGRPQRQMYDVDVNCAECGTHIAQLPFQPSGDRPVYCMNCNKNRRMAMDA